MARVLCPICGSEGEETAIRDLLASSQHVALREKYKCFICGEEVQTEEYLGHYVDKHKKVSGRNWQCAICGEKANSEAEFLRHLRLHFSIVMYRGGAAMHVCLICGRAFLGVHSLLVHMRKAHESG